MGGNGIAEDPAIDGLPDPAALVDPDSEFAPVPPVWRFDFPGDHGAHPSYRTEAWSFSGVLSANGSQKVGLQFAILRVALSDETPARRSGWATEQAYAGLLYLTDPFSGGVHSARRTSRGALGLAGATGDPIRLWVEDWRVTGAATDSGAIDARLRLGSDNLRLDLALANDGPLIDDAAPAGAESAPAAPFVFYTQPFLRADGVLTAGVNELQLTGRVSMEHAWGELPLPGGPVSRDRFVLFADDGRVLQLFRSEAPDIAAAATTGGFIFSRDTPPTTLSNRALEVEPLDYITSERTSRTYPVAWSVSVPEQGLRLRLSAEETDGESSSPPVWTGIAEILGPAGTSRGSALVQTSGQSEQQGDDNR